MDTRCPTCGELTYEIQRNIRWCSQCGTLLHPGQAAWFQPGDHSAPILVGRVRELLKRSEHETSYRTIVKESVYP